MKIFWPSGTARRFCAKSTLGRSIIAVRSLSELRDSIFVPATEEVTIQESLVIVKKCLELKNHNDPKYRGMIPRDLVSIISKPIITNLNSIDSQDLVDITTTVGDSARSMDKHLMYMIARAVQSRIDEFSIDQLSTISEIFSKRDLCDEALLDSIKTAIGIKLPNGVLFSQQVSILRSFSRLSIPNEELCASIANRLRGIKRLSTKDLVSILIAFADLGYIGDSDTTEFLWTQLASRRNVAKYISHDDQYGLLFAALTSPDHAMEGIVGDIITVSCSQGNTRKRVNLIRYCISANMLHSMFDPLLLCGSATSARAREIHYNDASSGMHFEVGNTLKRMESKFSNEIKCGEFIIDIVLDS